MILACESSKLIPAIYSHLNDFTGKLNFRYLSRPTNLESQNRAKNIPVGLPST